MEYSFGVSPGGRVEVGAVIGAVEGLKAVSELYNLVGGEFLGGNPDVGRDITLIDHDPYGKGWLYRAQGTAEPRNFDVQGYVGVLDATIDKMLRERHKGAEDDAKS